MLYTFSGGPLHGRERELSQADFKEGKYTYIEWGEYSSEFAILPACTIHQYLAVDNTLHWIEPQEISK